MVQIGKVLFRQCVLEWACAAIEFGPHLLAKFIPDRTERLDVPFDREDFPEVQRHCCTFENQGNLPIEEEADRPKTAVIGALSQGYPFEGPAGDSMQADFYAVGPQRGKAIRVRFGDQGPVREDGDQKSTTDGMFIQFEKVGTGERFASREAEFQSPGLG